MRDEQVRRYARHILVPDIGGLGQTALLVATARMEFCESEPDAELVAAAFLAAGGVGTIEIAGIEAAQLEQVAAHAHDSKLVTTPVSTNGVEVVLQPKPAWWPSAPGDSLALAYWRGSIAATRWMAAVANG